MACLSGSHVCRLMDVEWSITQQDEDLGERHCVHPAAFNGTG